MQEKQRKAGKHEYVHRINTAAYLQKKPMQTHILSSDFLNQWEMTGIHKKSMNKKKEGKRRRRKISINQKVLVHKTVSMSALKQWTF